MSLPTKVRAEVAGGGHFSMVRGFADRVRAASPSSDFDGVHHRGPELGGNELPPTQHQSKPMRVKEDR